MKKILIIEDDKTLQEAIKIALISEDFEVIQAMDGEEGMNKIKSEKPDLILLDLMLPKKDGYRLLYDLQKKSWFKNTPVVVLTAIDSEASSTESKSYGAVDYIVKSDFSIKEIVNKIKKFIK